jgi:hypothetical protein
LAKATWSSWDFMRYPKIIDAGMPDRAYSIAKARNELGCSSRCILEDGLGESAEGRGRYGIIL